MNKLKQLFYNRYHQKNDYFKQIIKEPNFTYFFLQKLIKFSLPQIANKQVLDLGCGVGAISLYLASKGAKTTGVDIAPRAIDIANQAAKKLKLPVEFICKDLITWLKQNKKQYDLIIASEIIEHLKQEQKFFKLAAARLKADGKLIITTPSPENLAYRLGWLKKFDQNVGHLKRYSQAELKKLIKQAGLKIGLMRQTQGPIRMLLYSGLNGRLGILIKFIKGPLISIFHALDAVLAAISGRFDWEVVVEKQN